MELEHCNMEVEQLVFKYEYRDKTDKQTILNDNKDKILIEEQNYFDGKFLVFSDTPREEDMLKDIKNNTDILILKQEGIL